MTKEKIHLIGIGGISMSGIARILLKRGYQVSGSDIKNSSVLENLKEMGADIYIGHAPDNIKMVERVVVSNAVPEDNIELKYARGQKLPVHDRAEMIDRLMEDYRGIAISGTHGKTTTTSLVTSLLLQGGLDPGVMLGGNMDILSGNARNGQGEFFVTEADESDGSLLYYNPEVAVITNLELDHHDFYDREEKLKKFFAYFLKKVAPEGKIIAPTDDKLLAEILDKNDPRVSTYGLNKGDLAAHNIRLAPFKSFYTVYFKENKLGEIMLPIPGVYNILNSLAAVAVAFYTGLEFGEIKKYLAEYKGVKRRFEKKGFLGDIPVVDDYAHHPTEIKAVLKTAQNTEYNRIIAVFQPHRYSRTRHLMKELSCSFKYADKLIMTEIYAADEKPSSEVSAEKLAEMTAENSDSDVEFIVDFEDIKSRLKEIIQPGDLLITLGAGDVTEIGDELLSEH